MILTFTPEKHEYKSIGEDIDWISVTSLVSYFKQSFNSKNQSLRSSNNKKSKWYGIPPLEIESLWSAENKRATDLGTWYHNQREKDIMEFETIERHGVTVPIIRPIYKDGVKQAPNQKLIPGVYPEHFVYLKSAGICGQADRIEVINNNIFINDYKSNKELKLKGYTNWEGVTTMMQEPLSHLEDCHYTHYSLQLSLYMYIMLKHNPLLSPSSMILDHVIFEEQARDKYDYPIYKTDSNGNFIVKEVKHYEVPYLKTEVIAMLNYLKNNRKQIKLKKH